jgi:hypothetical protein
MIQQVYIDVNPSYSLEFVKAPMKQMETVSGGRLSTNAPNLKRTPIRCLRLQRFIRDDIIYCDGSDCERAGDLTMSSVLTTYHGVLEEEGIVRLRQVPPLPAGTEVVVVVAQPVLSLEEQERRLAAFSSEEWRRSFDEYEAIVVQEDAKVDSASISDEELVALVHETRQEEE